MSHTIKILPSGRSFHAEEGDTLLEAALRDSVALPYGCRNGECGTCKAQLVLGQVYYPKGLPPALSPEEQGTGKVLPCQARPTTDVVIEAREIAAAAGIAVRTLPARVARMQRLSHDVMALYLKLPTTQRMQFLAGQYVDILLRDGTRRGFSIASAPHDDEFLELHVRLVEGGSFTGYVFHQMKEKDVLRIQGPLGSFFLREDSPRPAILMGGGTGFAPLKGMLEHAFHVGVSRPLHLYWGARARCDLYQDALPQRWLRERGDFRYTPVLSEPDREDVWTGRTGLVHRAVVEDHPDLSGYDLYMSGPPAMIAAARERFALHGLPEQQLYFDSFDFTPSHRTAAQT